MSVLTEVLKLFKYDPATDGDMTFNIGQCMNDNWDKLDAAILLAIAAAGAYTPEESYAVGDYCTYKGKLHKCSTAIPTGETWTEAHWTTTTVAAELAELSSQLSNLNTLVGGATTPQGALANLGAGVRPSLVDNGIFVGPNLPVNQRGDTSWSTSGCHLDRWVFEQAAACSIADDGLHIGNEQTITQAVDADTKDFLLGKTITVSALLSDGSFASATGVVALDGNGIFCHPKSGFDYGTFFSQMVHIKYLECLTILGRKLLLLLVKRNSATPRPSPIRTIPARGRSCRSRRAIMRRSWRSARGIC